MIRRPPRSTRVRSSAASDVYKRTILEGEYVPMDRRLVVNKDTGERLLYKDYIEMYKDPYFNNLQLSGFQNIVRARYWFLAFDALSRPGLEPERKNYGDSDIRRRPHNERMFVAQGFKTRLLNKMDLDRNLKQALEPLLKINIKKFKAFTNASEFFTTMRDYNDLVPTP